MKDLLIKLGLWEEKKPPQVFATPMLHCEHDEAWYQTALKHYCSICNQWFKTASIASHNRFKHKDA